MANEFPEALEDLIELLSGLPGVGKRSAERYALSMLDWDKETLSELAASLASLKDRVVDCTECGNLADSELCRICQGTRDKSTICIVEGPRQIITIEKSNKYNGLYHVLGGRLSPLDGVEPKDLNITRLFERIEASACEEIIMATSPDMEGEATANYLADELNKLFDIHITRIAQGVPLGSDISFADAATIGMAIESRRNIQS
ncbi:MAG: recombination protein RecR [Lentisphaeria bacterium]|nr:recombination mediator RecR [Lentisphaeria bacterium]NQZ70781.1 recombination protein RecR [Lentisphaeria bacterium]